MTTVESCGDQLNVFIEDNGDTTPRESPSLEARIETLLAAEKIPLRRALFTEALRRVRDCRARGKMTLDENSDIMRILITASRIHEGDLPADIDLSKV
jgi:hypothetical protein